MCDRSLQRSPRALAVMLLAFGVAGWSASVRWGDAAVAAPTPTPRPRAASHARPAARPTPIRVAAPGPAIDADLSVREVVVTPSDVRQGDNVTVNFLIVNAGNTLATGIPCKILYYTRGNLTSAADTVLLSVEPCPTVAPGNRRSVIRSVQIPFDLPISHSERIAVRLGIEAIESSPGGDASERARRALDNVQAVPITVRQGPLPDLKVESLEIVNGPVATTGDYVISFRIRNRGDRASQAFRYTMTASSNWHWGSWEVFARRVVDVRGLGAGEALALRLNVERARGAGTLDGLRFVIDADPDNRILESDEINNAAAIEWVRPR